MTDSDTDKLLTVVRATLNDGADHLDSDVQSRLVRIHARAMARHPQRQQATATALLSAARQLRDDSEGAQNLAITQRLNQARSNAVRSRQRAARNAVEKLVAWLESHRLAMPAGAFATICVMMTAVSLFYAGGDANPSVTLVEEIRLFASDEDVELYENLDFYLWLAENGLASN